MTTPEMGERGSSTWKMKTQLQRPSFSPVRLTQKSRIESNTTTEYFNRLSSSDFSYIYRKEISSLVLSTCRLQTDGRTDGRQLQQGLPDNWTFFSHCRSVSGKKMSLVVRFFLRKLSGENILCPFMSIMYFPLNSFPHPHNSKNCLTCQKAFKNGFRFSHFTDIICLASITGKSGSGFANQN